MQANEYNIFKTLEGVAHNLHGVRIDFEVIDIDVATGEYIGFYTENHEGGKTLLGGYAMVCEPKICLKSNN